LDENFEQGHPVHNPSDRHIRRHTDVRSVFQGVRVAGRVVRTRTRPRRGTGTAGTAAADGRDDDCTVVGVCDDVDVHV